MSLLSKHIDGFLDTLRLDKLYSAHTLSNYARDLNKFAAFSNESDDPVEELNLRACRQYLYQLEQDGLSPKSIARHIASLRSFWNYLIYVKASAFNPWEGLHLPKIQQKLPHILSQDAMHQFLENIPTDTAPHYRDKTICECLYASGIRVTELVSLNLQDILLDRGEMRIIGKGNKERIAIFGSTAREFLRTYINNIRPIWCQNDAPELFVNQRGTRLSVRTIQRIIKHHAEQQKVNTPLTPHTFRHTFATALFNGGADLRSIQELLGHSSLSTTQIYTHLSTKKLQEIYLDTHPRAAL